MFSPFAATFLLATYKVSAARSESAVSKPLLLAHNGDVDLVVVCQLWSTRLSEVQHETRDEDRGQSMSGRFWINETSGTWR
ncbi:hypothetical protein BC629DRAFT_1512139 [Irpex lacteus]|nr:hypothetical protein BC629DRAFT_1512139 [Irpex lacteus]